MTWLWVLAAVFLTACEDQGNPGDDNLLTGGSLIVILLIVGFLLWRRSKRN